MELLDPAILLSGNGDKFGLALEEKNLKQRGVNKPFFFIHLKFLYMSRYYNVLHV